LVSRGTEVYFQVVKLAPIINIPIEVEAEVVTVIRKTPLASLSRRPFIVRDTDP
jgi:hypothetical protein